MEIAKTIKEKYGYICPDIAKEFNKYDSAPEKFFKEFEGVNSVTKKVCVCSASSTMCVVISSYLLCISLYILFFQISLSLSFIHTFICVFLFTFFYSFFSFSITLSLFFICIPNHLNYLFFFLFISHDV